MCPKDTTISTHLITYGDALQMLGNVPHIGKHPNTSSICNLQDDLCKNGYRSMVESVVRYELNNLGSRPWTDWPDPGVHQHTTVEIPPAIPGGQPTMCLLIALEQSDNKVAYDMPTKLYLIWAPM